MDAADACLRRTLRKPRARWSGRRGGALQGMSDCREEGVRVRSFFKMEAATFLPPLSLFPHLGYNGRRKERRTS